MYRRPLDAVLPDEDDGPAGVAALLVAVHVDDLVELHLQRVVPVRAETANVAQTSDASDAQHAPFVLDVLREAVHQLVRGPLDGEPSRRLVQAQVPGDGIRQFGVGGQHQHVVLAEEQRRPGVLVQALDVVLRRRPARHRILGAGVQGTPEVQDGPPHGRGGRATAGDAMSLHLDTRATVTRTRYFVESRHSPARPRGDPSRSGRRSSSSSSPGRTVPPAASSGCCRSPGRPPASPSRSTWRRSTPGGR